MQINNNPYIRKEEYKMLRKEYGEDPCLSLYVIIPIDYEEHKDINVCLPTSPLYFL